MNIEKLKRALYDLASTSSELADVCEREDLRGFGPFWRSVSSEASAALASERFDKVALDQLIRDVVSSFSYQPGGFMELYIVRDDPCEQERENVAFERIRNAVRAAAGDVREATEEGELNPLQIRRALVDLESALLDLGMSQDAATARAILNAPAIPTAAALALGEAVLSHTDRVTQPRLQRLIAALRQALHGSETE